MIQALRLKAERRSLHTGYVMVGVSSTAAFYSAMSVVDDLISGDPAWVSLVGSVVNLALVAVWLWTIKRTKRRIRGLEVKRQAAALFGLVSVMVDGPAGPADPSSPDGDPMEGWAAQSTPYLEEMEDVAAGGVTETKEP